MPEPSPSREPALKILGARYLVTMDPQRRIITDGALLMARTFVEVETNGCK